MEKCLHLFQTSLNNSQKRGNGTEVKPWKSYLGCHSSPSPSADFNVMDYSHLTSVRSVLSLQDITESESHLGWKAQTSRSLFPLGFNLFSAKSINSSW